MARPRATAELALAEQALAAGDPKHAAHHAAGALALAPNDAKALALVDRLIDQKPGVGTRLRKLFSSDPAPLFPDNGWYGNAAVRARALARRRDPAGAFVLLVAVAQAATAVDYTPWFAELIEAAARADEALDTRSFAALGFRRLEATIGLMRLRPLELAALAPWAPIVLRLIATSGGRDPLLAVMGSGLLRRLGRADEAIALARAGEEVAVVEQAPLCEVQLGLGLRAAGSFDEACEVFLGLQSDTGDANYLAEAARARFDQGRFEDALALFERAGPADLERVLAKQACRWALGNEEGTKPVRRTFPEGIPSYDDLVRYAAGDGSHVVMADASANGLRDYWKKYPDDSPPIKAKVGVSCIEPPSVLMAFALATRGRAEPWDLTYTWAEAPSRDLRDPIAAAGAKLWRQRGQWPEQALPPPRPETLEAVAAVAAPPIPSMRDWRVRAARVTLPPDELRAALIHPPPPPAGVAPPEHVSSWQIAVALIMAAQRPEEPWLRSSRREALRSLVLGPPDWTAAAALVALTEVLLDDPDALDDATEWLETLIDQKPDRGHITWAPALEHLAARIPGAPSLPPEAPSSSR